MISKEEESSRIHQETGSRNIDFEGDALACSLWMMCAKQQGRPQDAAILPLTLGIGRVGSAAQDLQKDKKRNHIFGV